MWVAAFACVGGDFDGSFCSVFVLRCFTRAIVTKFKTILSGRLGACLFTFHAASNVYPTGDAVCLGCLCLGVKLELSPGHTLLLFSTESETGKLSRMDNPETLLCRKREEYTGQLLRRHRWTSRNPALRAKVIDHSSRIAKYIPVGAYILYPPFLKYPIVISKRY